MEQVAQQVAEQWRGLMALMTAQGASRQDIISLSASTAHAILALTGANLWPEGQTPPSDEKDAQDRFTAALDVLQELVT